MYVCVCVIFWACSREQFILYSCCGWYPPSCMKLYVRDGTGCGEVPFTDEKCTGYCFMSYHGINSGCDQKKTFVVIIFLCV